MINMSRTRVLIKWGISPTHYIKLVFLLQVLIKSILTWLIDSRFLCLEQLHELKVKIDSLG